MNIYLSGPMSGIPEFNAPAFKAAAKELRARGHHVMSPLEMDIDDGVDFNNLPSWGTLLSRDVKAIADSGIEGICVLPGWSLSRGARLEVALGLILRLPIILLSGGVARHDDIVNTLAESFKEI